MANILKLGERLMRWFFGAPFQELPPEFGDPVPPDLRLFEDQAVDVQHHPQGWVRDKSSGPKNR